MTGRTEGVGKGKDNTTPDEAHHEKNISKFKQSPFLKFQNCDNSEDNSFRLTLHGSNSDIKV